jgi:hypothetical protein
MPMRRALRIKKNNAKPKQVEEDFILEKPVEPKPKKKKEKPEPTDEKPPKEPKPKKPAKPKKK